MLLNTHYSCNIIGQHTLQHFLCPECLTIGSTYGILQHYLWCTCMCMVDMTECMAQKPDFHHVIFKLKYYVNPLCIWGMLSNCEILSMWHPVDFTVQSMLQNAADALTTFIRRRHLEGGVTCNVRHSYLYIYLGNDSSYQICCNMSGLLSQPHLVSFQNHLEGCIASELVT